MLLLSLFLSLPFSLFLFVHLEVLFIKLVHEDALDGQGLIRVDIVLLTVIQQQNIQPQCHHLMHLVLRNETELEVIGDFLVTVPT